MKKLNNIHVIVGTGLDGTENARRDDQFELWYTLAQHGFYTEPVSFLWPRDGYVFCNGRYIKKTEHGRCGEGGCFLEGKNFLLASDDIRLPHKVWRRSDPEELREYLEQLYGTRIFLFPTGIDGDGTHIDFYSLLLPTQKVLIVDSSVLTLTIRTRAFERMLADAGLESRLFNAAQSGVHYPLNALALPSGDHDAVFFDGKAEGLAAVLESCGAEPVPVQLKNDSEHGKIHCATNTMQGSNPYSQNTWELMTHDGYAVAFLHYSALRIGANGTTPHSPEDIRVMLDTKSRVQIAVKEGVTRS